MRLIDADALIIELTQQAAYFRDRANTMSIENRKIAYDACADCFKLAKQIVDNAPTVEQPTGEWERFEKCGMWHVLCRKCHHVYTVKYNFCPHCGEKKMKGGEE